MNLTGLTPHPTAEANWASGIGGEAHKHTHKGEVLLFSQGLHFI